jgi:hypothetical protein
MYQTIHNHLYQKLKKSKIIENVNAIAMNNVKITRLKPVFVFQILNSTNPEQ